MQTNLTGTWELTTENAASSYGQPVLLNRARGEVFGAGDIVKPYPSYGFMTAAAAVRRMAKTAKLTDKGREMVDRFAGLVNA